MGGGRGSGATDGWLPCTQFKLSVTGAHKAVQGWPLFYPASTVPTVTKKKILEKWHSDGRRTTTDRQSHRQTDRQTDRQSDSHTDRQTDHLTDNQTDRQTDKQTDSHTDRQGQTTHWFVTDD